MINPICFVCSKPINFENPDSANDYFIIQRRSSGPNGLYFHCDCFEAAAGPEFGKALHSRYKDKLCLICAQKPSVGRNLKTCQSCTERAPRCPSCGNRMALRVSPTNMEKFWGCTKFPFCKKTVGL